MKKNYNSTYNFKRFAEISNDTTPKAVELTSEGEGEGYNKCNHYEKDQESNYEVQSSMDKKTSQGFIKSAKHSANKEVSKAPLLSEEHLRQKITEQAQRLTQLEMYKHICEQKIKQLSPNQKFPVTEGDLRLNTNTSEKDVYSSRLTVQLENLPSNLDKLPVDKMKEVYLRLFACAKEMIKEKEMILESLRMETVTNEEQRNYIEILRQTIESAVIKQGLTAVLQSVRSGMKNAPDNVDILTDIALIKSEADKYRKDLVLAQVLISELKNEVEVLKKTNEDMNLKKEKIKENLESGIEELEHAKAQVENMEREKEEVVKSYDQIRVENKKLARDYDQISTQNKEYQAELMDKNSKIEDYLAQLEDHNLLQSKLEEYHVSFEKLYEDFENLMKQKSNVDIENSNMRDELTKKSEDILKLKRTIEEKEEKLENVKKNLTYENESLVRNNKKLERTVDDLTSDLQDKERDLRKLEERIAEKERELSKTSIVLDDSKMDFDQLKKSMEKKIEANDKIIRDLEKRNADLNDLYETVSKEKLNMQSEFFNLKAENQRLESEIKMMEDEINSRERVINKLSNHNDNLFADFKMTETEKETLRKEKENLSKEIRNLKERYEHDMNANLNEVNSIRREISSKDRNIEDLNRNILELEEQLTQKQETVSKLENDLLLVSSDCKTLQKIREELMKKCEKITTDHQREIKNNIELNSKLHNMNLKLDEMNKCVSVLSEEKGKWEINKKRIQEEFENLKKGDKESQMRSYNLNSKVKEYKQGIGSCFNIINSFSGKFTEIVNKPNQIGPKLGVNIFSSNFVNTLKSFSGEEKTTSDVLRQVEFWIRSISSEFEILYEQYERVVKELLNQRENNNGLFDQINACKDDLSKLNDINETIIREMRSKDQLLGNASFQVEALEDRIVILVREKKFLEALVNKIARNHPAKEMQRVVSDIMALHDSLAQMERDRVRVEDSIILLEEKTSQAISANSSRMNTFSGNETKLEQSMRNEKEKLKSLTNEYDRKIAEKKEQIKILENQINQVELSDKSISTLKFEYETKIQNLQKELIDAREDIKRNRTFNLGGTIRSRGNQNAYSSQNYQFESIDFEGGYRVDSDSNNRLISNNNFSDNY